MSYFKAMCDQIGYVPYIPSHWDIFSEFESDLPALERLYYWYKKKYCNKNYYKIWTEIVLMLNWKIWEHYELGNERIGLKYNSLWEDADNAGWKAFEGDDDICSYYFNTLD